MKMSNNSHLRSLAAAVVKRSGIHQATVEAVLPHVFDAIRYELINGDYHNVPIESFGLFCLKRVPGRQYHYTYNGADEWRTLPPKAIVKFTPTKSLRREVELGEFDTTRSSFHRHPDDPIIRRRQNMIYKPGGVTHYQGYQVKKSD